MIDKLNYENVLHVLTDNLNSSTKKNEREIAKALLNNFNKIPDLSIEALAFSCFVSQPTLTRYIKKLGYENYNEFKQYVTEFQHVLSNEVNNDIFKMNSDDVFSTPFKQAISSIEKTSKLISKNKMEEITDQIYNANQIVIIGIDYSELVAFDAQLRFMRYNVVMETAVKSSEQKQLVSSLKKGDLLIVLSVSGFTKGLQEVCQNINCDVNSIVISSNENPQILLNNPKRKVLNITTEVNQNVNSSLSGRLNLLMLIDCLYIQYGRKYYT